MKGNENISMVNDVKFFIDERTNDLYIVDEELDTGLYIQYQSTDTLLPVDIEYLIWGDVDPIEISFEKLVEHVKFFPKQTNI